MSLINLDDFFEFGNQAPINRIAYTKEDTKFKLKCIKAMQDLGREISIDYAGNICGTLKGDIAKGRTFVMGSHTDSVFDGGQFDGPVGVYMALKAVEDFKNSNAEQQGDLKVVIYACEESSRFSKACLGSHYLSGELSLEQLASLKDKQGMTFEKAVAEYRKYLLSNAKANGIDISRIMHVDKVLSQEEIAIAVE